MDECVFSKDNCLYLEQLQALGFYSVSKIIKTLLYTVLVRIRAPLKFHGHLLCCLGFGTSEKNSMWKYIIHI